MGGGPGGVGQGDSEECSPTLEALVGPSRMHALWSDLVDRRSEGLNQLVRVGRVAAVPW